MPTTTLAKTRQPAETTPLSSDILESVLVHGDLAKLSAPQRVDYYLKLCRACGLDPIKKPFAYIYLNGKLVLYALKAAAEQLRMTSNISIVIESAGIQGGLYVVRARASTPAGRTDESIGAVSLEGLKGEALANAIMKAETKAKRRVTLSICALGMLDETEVETVPHEKAEVDFETGQIVKTRQEVKLEDKTNRRWAWYYQATKLTETRMKALADLTISLGLTKEDMVEALKAVVQKQLTGGDAYRAVEAVLHEMAERGKVQDEENLDTERGTDPASHPGIPPGEGLYSDADDPPNP